MNYQGSQLLPQPFEHVCQALPDPAVLQQRIAGCKKFEHTGGDYKCILKVCRAKVSPLFASTETLADAVATPAAPETTHFCATRNSIAITVAIIGCFVAAVAWFLSC